MCSLNLSLLVVIQPDEPTDDESNKSENQNNLKEILNIKTNNTKKENTNKNTSLENKILEKINN